ncbi:MAG: glycosyltransferase family 4 protein [Propionibacteriaceae bacterium]|nr:glycosyltransferase family 4 protein [Propionibacteriaceae bacterium]
MTAGPALVRRALSAPLDYVLLCPAYPSHGRSGGEFIRTRVEAYCNAGLRGAVVEYATGTQDATVEADEMVTVIRLPAPSLPDVVEVVGRRQYPVLAHSPTPEAQDLLRDKVAGERLTFWFHGYEVRDHRRLYGNYSSREAPRYGLLLRPPQPAMEAAARTFRDPRVTKVFVSGFQMRASEFDVGAEVDNGVVIPNHIDGESFRYRNRGAADARSILLMRSFRARNYGNDIALRAIEHLSARAGFSDLQFTIRGFGALFEAETAGLFRYENVDIVQRYSTPVEMAAAHYSHGVFLCPSRYDTQGVMLGEAMASGMVCVTNRVAAIPEFTDETCSLLVKPDDPLSFAEAIWALVENPHVLAGFSRRAAARVRSQCGYDATIARELELIRNGSVL